MHVAAVCTQGYTADTCAHGYTAASSVALLWEEQRELDINHRIIMTDHVAANRALSSLRQNSVVPGLAAGRSAQELNVQRHKVPLYL